jgi:hypothetical protein
MSRGIKELKQARSLTTIDKGHTTDHNRPEEEEGNGLVHRCNIVGGADILKYVVTTIRNNVLCVISVLSIG